MFTFYTEQDTCTHLEVYLKYYTRTRGTFLDKTQRRASMHDEDDADNLSFSKSTIISLPDSLSLYPKRYSNSS